MISPIAYSTEQEQKEKERKATTVEGEKKVIGRNIPFGNKKKLDESVNDALGENTGIPRL